MNLFYLLVGLLLVQRLSELYIANRNEQWMKARGAVEVGSEHYKYFVFLHAGFFLCLCWEVLYSGSHFSVFFFFLFILLQIGRVWCILSLGRFWNTKIIVLQNVLRIRRGPYRYVKHPNYWIVLLEFFVIPFMFGAYWTGMLFPVMHALLLLVRIPYEERALGKRA